MTTTDAMGECVTEAELDSPLTWQNKAAELPRTCFDAVPLDFTPDLLAEMLGHYPSYEEWTAAKLSWCRASGECSLRDPGPLPVAPVPLAPSLVLMLCAVAALAAVGLKRGKV